MARGNRPIEIRVDDETRDRWTAAARDAGQTLSAFVRDATDAAVTGATPKRPAKKKVTQVTQVTAGPPPVTRADGSCYRERFHRPGTFCKACGTTP